MVFTFVATITSAGSAVNQILSFFCSTASLFEKIDQQKNIYSLDNRYVGSSGDGQFCGLSGP
jgi:hypothetical protein